MTQKRVLLVDDESMTRTDMREMLVNLGYQVVGEAGDAETGIRLARELRPDLVIMDIIFESDRPDEMDGIKAAKVLAEERIAPVLLVTAHSIKEFVDGAISAGVVGYVIKPFREEELVPAIEVALARFKELRDTRDALEARRFIERAKGVLMDTQGLSEQEAFRRIQKISMNSRKSMREVAEAILLAHQARVSD